VRARRDGSLVAAAVLATLVACQKAPAAPAPLVTTETLTGAGAPTDGDPRQLLALLEYVAADYPGAVKDGQVLSDSEFAEQKSLLGDAAAMAAQLPPHPGIDAPAEVAAVEALVSAKASDADVAARCDQVRQDVVRVYGIQLLPTSPPSLSRAQQLFAQTCQGCHGPTGEGNGPDAARYNPPPANFHDPQRMGTLSPYRAFNAITYGTPGTAMAAWGNGAYSDDDRWSLAFYVMGLRYTDADAAHGQELYGQGQGSQSSGVSGVSGMPASLDHLADTTENDLAGAIQGDNSQTDAADVQSLMAYLRKVAPYNPPAQSYDVARSSLRDAVAAYDAGQTGRARSAAVSAYLDGFEPHEAALRVSDGDLVDRTERAFMDLRGAIDAGAPQAEVESREADVMALLDLDDEAGHHDLSATAAALAAAAIILREGLESALLIALLLGVVRKARPDDTAGASRGARWIHAGWLSALAAGGVTFWLSSHLLPQAGRGREIGEGAIGLFAAVVLFTGGHWLLARRDAKRRVSKLQLHARAAAQGGKVGLLGGLAFLTVYREMFEVVVFLRALVDDAGGKRWPVLVGIGGGLVVLGVLVMAFNRFGRRLKPGPLLTLSGLILCVLAIVFTGEGIRSLQEAGVVALAPLAQGPHLAALGIYPSWATLIPQVSLVVILLASVVFSFLASRNHQPPEATAPAAVSSK
jgi:high-affinity iron transporter